MKTLFKSLACAAMLVGAAATFAAQPAGSFDERYLAARELALSGEREAAIAAYTTLLEASPGNADVLLGRGRVYAWMGRWTEGEVDLRAATDAAPAYADAWSALGDLYLWSDRPPQAVEAYGRWLALAPVGDPAPLLARGRALRAAGDRPAASADFEAARARGADAAQVDSYLQSLTPTPAPLRALEPSALASGRYRWSASLGAQRTEYPAPSVGWNDYTASVRRYFEHGSVAIEGLAAERFAIHDTAWAIDGYADLWRRAYVNLRFQQGPGAKLFPRTRWRAELFQGFGRGWEASASYDRMNFNSAVDLYGLGLGRYFGNWYVRLRHLYIPGTASDPSSSNSDRLTVRYYYAGDGDNYVEVAGGVGRTDQATAFVFGGPPAGHSWSGSAAFVKFLTPRIGFKLGIDGGYGLEGLPYSNRGIFGTLYTRW